MMSCFLVTSDQQYYYYHYHHHHHHHNFNTLVKTKFKKIQRCEMERAGKTCSGWSSSTKPSSSKTQLNGKSETETRRKSPCHHQNCQKSTNVGQKLVSFAVHNNERLKGNRLTTTTTTTTTTTIVAGTRAQNSLPPSVRNASSLMSLRRNLKTALFRSSFSDKSSHCLLAFCYVIYCTVPCNVSKSQCHFNRYIGNNNNIIIIIIIIHCWCPF